MQSCDWSDEILAIPGNVNMNHSKGTFQDLQATEKRRKKRDEEGSEI